jgi:RNA polymerase sigma-70 factor (ECF subfamily)
MTTSAPELDREIETDLVRRAQEGDADAFADLYRAYHDSVMRILMSRMGRDRPLCEDITALTFQRAWVNIGRFSPDCQTGKFGGWLNVIANNLLRDHIKSNAHQREWLVDDIWGTSQWLHLPTTPGADHGVESAELRSRLLAAISTLTPGQRTAVVMVHDEGRPHAEVGLELGISALAAKTLLYRATQQLRRQLADVYRPE